MYSVEFFEDVNGKSDMRDFLHLLYETQKNSFYRLAAFLDFLGERGKIGDKAVCRFPGGTIYMHCIPGIDPPAGTKGRRLSKASAGVCVILYGQYSEGEKAFVLLHHYMADKVPGGVPLLQMYQAVRELQAHRQMR